MKRLLVVLLLVVAALVALDRLAPHTTAGLLLGLARRQSGLAAKRVHTGDLDVAYLDGGSGPPLVLVHGFGGDKDSFVRLAGFLVPQFRVVIPDLPGFGESSRPGGVSYAVGPQAERLREFVRALGLGRVHLGGNSMGGFIVTEYALAHPEEVATLWLLAPAGTRVAFDSELVRQIDGGGGNPLLPRTPDEYARTMAFVMAQPPFVPYAVVRTLADRAAADHALHARIFEEVGPHQAATLDDRLRRLAVPALVVWGSSDRALDPRAAEVYRSAMPNARVVLMPGIGHLPMLEAPAEVAVEYLRFRNATASDRQARGDG